MIRGKKNKNFNNSISFQKYIEKEIMNLKLGKTSRFPKEMFDILPSGKKLIMSVITRSDTQKSSVIKLLAKWRKVNNEWFPSQFTITEDGTQKWAKEQLIEKKDRILFFLTEEGERSPFGHIGLYRFNYKEKSCEIDNVIRGVSTPGSKGGMTIGLQLLIHLALNQIGVEKLYLRVFSDNKKAIALYKNLNFKEVERIPVVKNKIGDITSWVSQSGDSKIKTTRYFVKMILDTKNKNLSKTNNSDDIRILLLANSWVGLKVAQYLKRNHEKIVGLGIHEPKRQKLTDKIIEEVNLPESCIIVGSTLRSPDVIEKIKKMNPDIIIAAFWGYILKPEIFEIPHMGCINFHPGYLPYNRGMNPNVWPFIEGSPAGVTIHYIDAGVDTGDIIAQKQIEILPYDTAGSIEKKTWREIVKLFKANWRKIKSNKIIATEQRSKKFTLHYAKDIDKIDKIELDKKYTGREIINILRARSYTKSSFTYFEEGDKQVSIRVVLAPKK